MSGDDVALTLPVTDHACSLRLQDRRAVVTGAAGGIGRAIAVGVAAAGATVVCVDLNGEGAAAVAAEICRQGNKAVGFGADLTDYDAVELALERSLDVMGGVDLLLANAGGLRDGTGVWDEWGGRTPFLKLTPTTWSRMIDQNLTTAFFSGLVFARQMAKLAGGAVVFTSSQLAEVVRPGLTHYASAKGGLRQLVKGMAVELASDGIRVNAIAPGPTLTDASSQFNERPEVREEHARATPLGRLAMPSEMVGAAVFLASDEASFVTGTTILVDGGYTII